MYNFLATEFPLNEISIPELSKAYEVWQGWKGSHKMPSWQKIDMFDLPSSLIPYTAVVNVTHDPMDFVYRYWGSGMTEVQEQESTNCSVNDLEPDFISQAIFQAYNDVIHRAEPVYIINTYRNENKLLIEDHFLRLPLSDTGTTVDMVMSIYKTSNSSFKQLSSLDSYSNSLS